jgi:uncharacterized protein with GYD domain
MLRYLSLVKFTDEGVRNARHSVARAAEFSQAVAAAEGKVLSVYWALGSYDGAIAFEVPTEGVAATLLLKLGAKGFVRTETMRIFTSEEFAGIADKA